MSPTEPATRRTAAPLPRWRSRATARTTGELGREHRHDRGGCVGRTVVDDDHLHAELQVNDASHDGLDRALLVERRDDDTYEEVGARAGGGGARHARPDPSYEPALTRLGPAGGGEHVRRLHPPWRWMWRSLLAWSRSRVDRYRCTSVSVASRAMRVRSLVPCVAVALCAALAPSASAAPPAPFGHACQPRAGVLFCPTADDAARVPSFDGVPLDVDVWLPATGDGPFPTIVMLHGFGGSKTDFQGPQPAGYNAMYFASKGYAVVLPSARGFGRSCGVPDSRTAGCERGWLHLDDQRYEARDVQWLLARLVDQLVARPDQLGVTGHLLWRRRLAGARDARRSHPPARRHHRVLAVARRRAALDRGRVAPLAVDRSGRRAHAQRPPGAAHVRQPHRRRDPGLRGRALRAGQLERLRGARGRRPRGRPHRLEAARRSRRALRRRRARRPGPVAHLPRRPGPADRQGDHPAARAIRLDRRPLPRRAGPAHLRPAAPEEQDRTGGAAARRPRPLPRRQPLRRHRGLQRPGPRLLRGAPEALRQGPRARERDQLHPDAARGRPRTAAAPIARRRSRRWPVASSSSATRPPSA